MAAARWCQFAAALLLFVLMSAGAVRAATGVVTNFTVNGNSWSYVQVMSGVKLQLRCRVTYNNTLQPPVVKIKKVDFSNRTWLLTENDDYASDTSIPDGWSIESTDASLLPPNTMEYIFTIYPTRNSDSGNYTCNVAGPSAFKNIVKVDVVTEASVVSMMFNGKPITADPMTGVQVTVGQQYSVSCNISGGNPYPNVNISTSKGQLTPTQTNYYWTATSSAVNEGFVFRSTNVSVNPVIFDASMLGKPVTCAGGVLTSSAVSTYFTPVSDDVVPHFRCGDKVVFRRSEKDLVINCQVYAPNLNLSHVRWSNSTGNSSINGVLGRTVKSVDDARYSLHVTPPVPAHIQLYTMTLTVSRAHDIKDIDAISYKFVAVNNKGQSLHSVNVQPDTAYVVGKASGNVVSAVEYLLTLVIAAVAIGAATM